jgi:hypothetical protein
LALEYKKASILHLPHSLAPDEAEKMIADIDAALEWLRQQEQPHTVEWTGPSGRKWKVDIEGDSDV